MAIAVAAWPSTINVTNFSDYGETWDTNFAEFAPEVGPPKRRRRMSLSSETLSPVMYLTSAEVETFRTFYRDTLKDGTLPFTFPKPCTGVIEQYTFSGSAPQVKFADYGLYQVSMTWRSVPNTRASWLPLLTVSGALIPSIAPDTFADFTTEGSTDPHYWYLGNRYASFATWLAAMGGTFTRAGAARYLQGGVVKTALSNVPRFPTDVNGVATGIRLTGPATNIKLHSQIDASWTGSVGTLTTGVVPGPDGGATSAATFIPNTSSSNHGIFLTAGTTYAAATYTLSIFAKNNGYNFLLMDPLNAGSGGTANAIFNLTTGASITGAGAISSGTIQLANGWWYCWMTMTFSAGSPTNIFGVLPTSTFAIYSGNGTSGINLFGAQATATTFPADYIPTTTAAVTQAADVLSFPFTQTAFSAFASCINQNDDATGAGQRLFGLSTYAPLYLVSGLGVTFNGTSALNRTLNSYASLNKLMVAGNGSGRSLVANGGAVVSDANVLIGATPTTGWLGSDAGTSHFSYGDMRQFALWSSQVASVADLVRLTT